MRIYIKVILLIYALIFLLLMGAAFSSCKTSRKITQDTAVQDSLSASKTVNKDTSSASSLRTEQVKKEEKNTTTEHSVITPTVIYVKDSGREKPVIVYVTDTKKTRDETVNTSQLIRDSTAVIELKLLASESITQTRALQQQFESYKKSNLSGNFVLIAFGFFGVMILMLTMCLIFLFRKLNDVTNIIKVAKTGL